MFKPFTTICLAGAALFAVGAYLSAQGGKQPAAGPPARITLAMQEPAAATSQETPAAALAKMGWIGIMMQDNKGSGARVVSVFPAGPAAVAGVRVGDVLVRVGGTEIASPQDAETALAQLAPHKQTTVTVERRGKKHELKLLPESLAEFKQAYVAEMLHRDPRDPNYAKHHGVSEADMGAEVVRRLFEQHERMERTLHDVLTEVQALRKEVAALKNNR
jgi:membrane-associated protease RseP (regulator of RpoE activity)